MSEQPDVPAVLRALAANLDDGVGPALVAEQLRRLADTEIEHLQHRARYAAARIG